MPKKILFIASFLAAFSAPGRLFAGGLEMLATNAEKSFAKASVQQVKPFVPTSQAQALPGSDSAASEYQKLAAAFEAGTAPKQEELMGWHAGRILDDRFPDMPGSILLAAQEIKTFAETGSPTGKAYKLIPLVLFASPTFYETMDESIVAGVKVYLKAELFHWTIPQFNPTGIAFEMVMPAYDTGFSRYEVRKASDGRILIKHVWKSVLGDHVFDGIAYAFLTKDVTPR